MSWGPDRQTGGFCATLLLLPLLLLLLVVAAEATGRGVCRPPPTRTTTTTTTTPPPTTTTTTTTTTTPPPPQPCTEDAECPSGSSCSSSCHLQAPTEAYNIHNATGRKCFFGTRATYTYADATSYCQALGDNVDLPVPENDEDNQVLKSLMQSRSYRYAWLGIVWLEDSETFRSVYKPDTELQYQNWYTDNPFLSSDRQCVYIAPGLGGKWVNRDCGSVSNVVCQMRLAPGVCQ